MNAANTTTYSKNNKTVEIDYSKDRLITAFGIGKLNDGYYRDEEISPQEVFARVATALGNDDKHAQRLYDYMSNLWFMPATPILSNAGTKNGLPISCFLSHVDDSVEGLGDHLKEVITLSTIGGGVAGHWSDVRSQGENTSKGNRTTGTLAWMTLMDKVPIAAQQGSTRRGAYASYLDVSHPEIEAFLDFRNPTGGDLNLKGLNIHIGVNITDDFMIRVMNNEEFNLVDPNSHKVKKTVRARDLWVKIINTRMKTGEPYLHFIDTANRALPQSLKDKGLQINGSNLCAEIELPTSNERTAVCCLSSVNLEKYDEWKDNKDFIKDIMYLLDNTLQDFIDKAPASLSKAVYSARHERSVGLGTFGFHGLLMKNSIPFESVIAKAKNLEVFKYLNEATNKASLEIGKERGESIDMQSTLILTNEDNSITRINSSDFVFTSNKGKIRAFMLEEGDDVLSILPN